jgi:hypothetical protein
VVCDTDDQTIFNILCPEARQLPRSPAHFLPQARASVAGYFPFFFFFLCPSPTSCIQTIYIKVAMVGLSNIGSGSVEKLFIVLAERGTGLGRYDG